MEGTDNKPEGMEGTDNKPEGMEGTDDRLKGWRVLMTVGRDGGY